MQNAAAPFLYVSGWLEAHGWTLMLCLLALRWMVSIFGLIQSADSRGRSLLFDVICLAAYLAGVTQYRAMAGPDWYAETTGLFLCLNIALIAFDLALLLHLRRIERRDDRLMRPKVPS